MSFLEMMFLEPLLCPCCTPAILHSLSQASPAMLTRQLMQLGSGALTAAIARVETESLSKELDGKEVDFDHGASEDDAPEQQTKPMTICPVTIDDDGVFTI